MERPQTDVRQRAIMLLSVLAQSSAVVLDHFRITRMEHGWFSITHLGTTNIQQPCFPLPGYSTIAIRLNPLMVGPFVSLYIYISSPPECKL